jgi:hypothetical protein
MIKERGSVNLNKSEKGEKRVKRGLSDSVGHG